MTWALAGAEAIKLLKRFWYVLPIAALTVALLLTRGTLADRTVERDGLKAWQTNVREVTSRAADIRDKAGKPALLALDQVPTQITYLGQGVDRLTIALADKNRESEQRAAAYRDALAQDAQNRADADRRFAAAQSSIERLRALAAKPANPQCPASPDLLRELDGL